MPFLIDGNNLMYALAEVGPEVSRVALCELLGVLVAGGERVCVVFDGPPRQEQKKPIAESGVQARYAVGHSADKTVIELIEADSAPRHLTVVSSDREIRKVAKRRRCVVETSEAFARKLLNLAREHVARGFQPPDEPPEKRHGLTKKQTKHWLKEFGID
jgi:hypothetical protein